MEKEKVTKLDGARRHLDEAIRLLFENRDPLIVHTLSAAAQGALRDIAKNMGTRRLSILHDNSQIPEELRKKWIDSINVPRNFFKHADKDPQGILEFDENDNIYTLLDATILYLEASDEYLSAANVFIGWFTTKYPEISGLISHNKIGDFAVKNGISPSDKERFLSFIDARILVG